MPESDPAESSVFLFPEGQILAYAIQGSGRRDPQDP